MLITSARLARLSGARVVSCSARTVLFGRTSPSDDTLDRALASGMRNLTRADPRLWNITSILSQDAGSCDRTPCARGLRAPMLRPDAEPSRKERGHRGVRPRHPNRSAKSESGRVPQAARNRVDFRSPARGVGREVRRVLAKRGYVVACCGGASGVAAIAAKTRSGTRVNRAKHCPSAVPPSPASESTHAPSAMHE
jgi:hypothetical protein